jgi:serine/threonine-protein kinase
MAGIATRDSLADGSVRELPSVVAIADLVCDAATTTEGQSPSSPSPAPETTPGREPGAAPRAHTPVRWGRFRVLAPLGSGAYGEVHRAQDIELDREVALKLLKPSRSDRDHTLRLLEEARMLAQVRHPNVASVYGVGEHDGRVGFWMELVRGATLEELLRTQGPRGAGEAALVGRDLCRALAAVHGAGLVHGDVKTSNVMRETGGRIVLMDFGAGGCRGRENGRAMGTPPYTAPEVRSGNAASALSDIYSLGVVLFRLVTAAYPGKAVSFGDLAEPQEYGPALSLQDLRPELPDVFVSVVEQAIASEPGERPQTAGTLHAALCGVLGVPAS